MDDDEADRKAMLRALKKQGYEVDMASGIRDVVNVVDQFNPEVIILDIHMPIFDGADLGKVLVDKTEFKSTPIIYHSGMNREEVNINMRPTDRFVSKDLDMTPLLETVGQMCSHLD